MSQSDYLVELLKLIEKHQGSWTWYQLDRALAARGLIPEKALMAILRDAESEGLIRSSPGATPALPVYRMTERGREKISVACGRQSGHL